MPPLRALVASGDPKLRSRIADLLNRSQAVVREASTSEQALSLAALENLDVAFLDEALPGVSGSAVAGVVRGMERPLKPIVVYRANAPYGVSDALDADRPGFERALLAAAGLRRPEDPVRVFVVDDHEMVRRGLHDLANEEPGLVIVGEAANAEEASGGIAETRPDVALLDVRLPDGDGVELCREIRSRYPEIQCLMFTSYADEEALLKAIMAGASGYLLKGIDADELVQAIRAVAAGGSLIDPATSRSLMELVRRSPAKPEVKLSAQQERVLDLIVEGLTNREIGDRLELAEKTVKNYVSVILDKVGVKSRTQAAVWGARLQDEHRRDGPA